MREIDKGRAWGPRRGSELGKRIYRVHHKVRIRVGKVTPCLFWHTSKHIPVEVHGAIALTSVQDMSSNGSTRINMAAHPIAQFVRLDGADLAIEKPVDAVVAAVALHGRVLGQAEPTAIRRHVKLTYPTTILKTTTKFLYDRPSRAHGDQTTC